MKPAPALEPGKPPRSWNPLFQRADMVEAGWSVITPVLDVWQALPPRDFPNYSAGSWGPKEAEEMVPRTGRERRAQAAAASA